MEDIFDVYRKTKHLHHAYLIEDDEGGALGKLTRFIENDLGMPFLGNPDIWNGSFETFGIAEGRMLRDLQARRAVTGDKRLFVVSTRFFTREAQHALLKVFEEPHTHVHFFIITPRADVLLPTLISRLFVISRETLYAPKGGRAETFISGTIQERMKVVTPMVEKKDKTEVMTFLNNVEYILGTSGELPKNKKGLNDIIKCRRYLYGNAPALKMILEHLAVTLPQVKKRGLGYGGS